MGLQHADTVVPVDNQARKSVAFSVDEPVAVGGRIGMPISVHAADPGSGLGN